MIVRLAKSEQLVHVLETVSKKYMRNAADDMGDFLLMMPSLTRMADKNAFLDLYEQHKMRYEDAWHHGGDCVIEMIAQERKSFFAALASIVPREKWPLFLYVGHIGQPMAGGRDLFEFSEARDVKASLFDCQWEHFNGEY